MKTKKVITNFDYFVSILCPQKCHNAPLYQTKECGDSGIEKCHKCHEWTMKYKCPTCIKRFECITDNEE